MTRALHAWAFWLTVVLACSPCARAAPLELDVELDPRTRRFAAVAELVAPGNLAFFLHESLAVRSVTAAGQPAAARSTRERDRRHWRIEAAPGATVRIEYGGVLPALDTTLDHRGVLRSHTPMTSPEGTFLPAGSGWYPQLGALFEYRVRIVLPADQRGLVAGRLVRESIPAAASEPYRAEFDFAQPAEGIDLMAGPYVVRERSVARPGAAPLRLRTYFTRELDRLSASYLDHAGRFIASYSARVGDYPFDGFSVVASPLPTGYGMPGLTYIGARVLELPFILTTSLAHEVLHNWWGNGVYVDYASGNWSEGLTTLMADYHLRELESAAAAREMRLGWLRDFAAVPAGGDRALSTFRSRTHGAEAAVGYGKAAMLFLMLRDALGSDVFDRALQRLWSERRFQVTSWDDLRSAFESVSGAPLSVFFDQWVQRPGAPHLAIASASTRREGARHRLALALTQQGPPYALDVPVEISASGGLKREQRRVRVDRERQAVEIELDFEPAHVRLDPDVRVWRVLHSSEMPPILRRWIVARTPRLLLASADPDFGRAARTVAEAFLERSPQPVTSIAGSPEPLLMIGTPADVDAALRAHDLPARPPVVATDSGSAQVWTIAESAGRAPVAVISARDARSLAALARPLPHYGSQSWLVFDGTRATARGVWPGEAPQIAVNRD